MASESVTIRGKEYNVNDVLQPWLNRKEEAINDRKQYLTQIKVNRCFAAGKQQLDVNTRDGRVIEVRRRGNVELIQSNILTQYLLTVVGRLSATDYKPNWLVAQNNPQADDIAEHMNMGFSWGWDHEWAGDEAVRNILRYLAIDGTLAVQTVYDRRYGELVGDVPYKDGSPILDDKEAAKYVAEQHGKGESANLRSLREGKICWRLNSMENMLWPAGFEDPKLFPWEAVCRPVSVAEVKDRYGSLAEEVGEEDIEAAGSLLATYTDGEAAKLSGKTMLYTGYERPNSLYPKGRTVVFAGTSLLDVTDTLPLSDHPLGPRTGIHYFRWEVLPGRFPGKAFIENGIGGQKVYNKRLTQMNAIIDRNMPVTYIEEQSLARRKTGEPFEYVEVRPGAPLPRTEGGLQLGAWWIEEVKLQESAVEKALGIRGVSMGQAPQGVSAYSAMALLTENDQLKLDAIAAEFADGMDDLSWDTMEQMRNWPRNKQMMIAGPENRLQEFTFKANRIPEKYLLKRVRSGAVPRSQAAEIQKVNDIWAASKGALPLTWYIDSLNVGRPLDLPPSIGDTDAHIAELENVIIENTAQPPPVAPYHDHARHVEIHRPKQAEAQSRVDQGDESALELVAAYQAHIEEHESVASRTQATLPPMPTAPAPPPSGEMNAADPMQAGALQQALGQM